MIIMISGRHFCVLSESFVKQLVSLRLPIEYKALHRLTITMPKMSAATSINLSLRNTLLWENTMSSIIYSCKLLTWSSKGSAALSWRRKAETTRYSQWKNYDASKLLNGLSLAFGVICMPHGQRSFLFGVQKDYLLSMKHEAWIWRVSLKISDRTSPHSARYKRSHLWLKHRFDQTLSKAAGLLAMPNYHNERIFLPYASEDGE